MNIECCHYIFLIPYPNHYPGIATTSQLYFLLNSAVTLKHPIGVESFDDRKYFVICIYISQLLILLFLSSSNGPINAITLREVA